VQVLQGLFYVLLHVLFYLWSLLNTTPRRSTVYTPWASYSHSQTRDSPVAIESRLVARHITSGCISPACSRWHIIVTNYCRSIPGCRRSSVLISFSAACVRVRARTSAKLSSALSCLTATFCCKPMYRILSTDPGRNLPTNGRCDTLMLAASLSGFRQQITYLSFSYLLIIAGLWQSLLIVLQTLLSSAPFFMRTSCFFSNKLPIKFTVSFVFLLFFSQHPSIQSRAAIYLVVIHNP